jgi:signal transduction histidine kinase
VLAVDDDGAVLHAIKRSLSRDYEVTLAGSGEEALRLAGQAPPDLILSDFSMPLMNGDELLRLVRTRPELDAVPLIVLTAHADHHRRLEMLRQGAQDFLVKPFSGEELRIRVGSLVEMKLARELLQQELASSSKDIALLIAEAVAQRVALREALNQAQAARDEAERSNRAKSALLALVSHELKTPLTVIRLTTDLWRRRIAQTPHAAPSELKRFEGATLRLDGMVDSLLEAARIQTGHLEPKVETFDLTEMIISVAADHEWQIQDKALTLRLDLAEEARHLTSDPRLVRLILSNLLGNAVKYTDEGAVDLRTYRSNGTVLVVRDTGRGISAPDTSRIFDPFVHLETMENKTTPGMGLGLALVRDMVVRAAGNGHRAVGAGDRLELHRHAGVTVPTARRGGGGTRRWI